MDDFLGVDFQEEELQVTLHAIRILIHHCDHLLVDHEVDDGHVVVLLLDLVHGLHEE